MELTQAEIATLPVINGRKTLSVHASLASTVTREQVIEKVRKAMQQHADGTATVGFVDNVPRVDVRDLVKSLLPNAS